MQDWLNVVQYITSSSSQNASRAPGQADSNRDSVSSLGSLYQSQEAQAKPLSVSALSQLMLRKDHSISSCARDVIMKPLLSSGSSIEHIKDEINEWQDLIMDTYLKLKEDSSMRQAYDATGVAGVRHQPQQPSQGADHSAAGSTNSTQSAHQPLQRGASGAGSLAAGKDQQPELSTTSGERRGRHSTTGDGDGLRRPAADDGQISSSSQRTQHDKSINHFFGELEIRGLVNLSYYALYSQDGPEQFRIDADVQNRLCKCTVILTREIMTKFTANNKEH